jgi:hypothetical protein
MFAELAPKEVCCGRDKGMLNGCSFNWESMATRERESLEMRCVESLFVIYMCVCLPHHNVL